MAFRKTTPTDTLNQNTVVEDLIQIWNEIGDDMFQTFPDATYTGEDVQGMVADFAYGRIAGWSSADRDIKDISLELAFPSETNFCA